MHNRMQRFHAPIEHFGKMGDLADVLDFQARLRERLSRPAGRDEFHAQFGEGAGEFDQPGFVADAEQADSTL